MCFLSPGCLKTIMKLVISYSVFAVVAILVNLLSQELSLQVYQGGYALTVSILAGTVTGLIIKFLLDKAYIFNYKTTSVSHGFNRFVAYSVTGVVTTLIFWGFELGFEFVFASKLMRYCGAVTGLIIGYVIKYQLDSRYVFSTRTG